MLNKITRGTIMKARIIYLATLMMTMFVLSACSNEDELGINDNENFPEISEEFKDNSIVIKNLSTHIKENTKLSHQEREGYRSYYECFHSIKELEDSPYASLTEELPKVDWEKQTLVIAYVYHNYVFNPNGCYVYSKSNKYTIEYRLIPSILTAYDTKGIAIILNQPNISKKDVNFRISIEGIDYK